MSRSYERARVLYRQGRYDAARDEIKNALAEDARDADALALDALCLVHKKNFIDARLAAESAIALEPSSSFAYHALAWVFYKDEDYSCRRRIIFAINDHGIRKKCLSLALTALDESIRLNPHSADSFWLRSLILSGRGERDLAFMAVEQGLALEPSHTGCLIRRSELFIEAGQAMPAAASSSAALAVDPESYESHLAHGHSLLRAGNHRQALDHFVEAIRLRPNSPVARRSLILGLQSRHWLFRLFLRLCNFVDGLRTSMCGAMVVTYAYFYLILGAPVIALSIANNAKVPSKYFAPLAAGVMLPGLCLVCARSFFNALLQFDPLGRNAISRKARVCAWIVVGAIGALYPLLSIQALLCQWQAATITSIVGFVVMFILFLGSLFLDTSDSK